MADKKNWFHSNAKKGVFSPSRELSVKQREVAETYIE